MGDGVGVGYYIGKVGNLDERWHGVWLGQRNMDVFFVYRLCPKALSPVFFND